MQKKAIYNLLPQKYPFVFVDGIIKINQTDSKITCYKNVTLNDNFFQGHFPENPVMPGVIIIEALAQTGIILFSLLKNMDPKDKTQYDYYLGKIQARFNKPVRPGDKLILEAELEKEFKDKGIIKGKAKVKDTIVATANIIFGLKPKNQPLSKN
jgi:beta-hydroxyacyl-ACP dehydratase FabZ